MLKQDLVQTPRYGCQVTLVLSPITGLVSPQCHVNHNDYFETTSPSGNLTTHSTWQQMAGLTVKKMDEHAPDGQAQELQESTLLNNNTYPEVMSDADANHIAQGDLGHHPKQDDATPACITPTVDSADRDTSENEAPHRLMNQPTSQYRREKRLTKRLQDTLELRALTSTLTIKKEIEPITDIQDTLAMLSTMNYVRMNFHQVMNKDDIHQSSSTI